MTAGCLLLNERRCDGKNMGIKIFLSPICHMSFVYVWIYISSLLMTVHDIKNKLSIGNCERTAVEELGEPSRMLFIVGDVMGLVVTFGVLVLVVGAQVEIIVGSVASGSTSG